MIELTKKESLSVVGGAWSGAVVTAVTKLFNTIFEFGRSFGTSIRRAIQGKMCSL